MRRAFDRRATHVVAIATRNSTIIKKAA